MRPPLRRQDDGRPGLLHNLHRRSHHCFDMWKNKKYIIIVGSAPREGYP